MIGDREHDLIGARRCRVRTIGVTYGYGSEAELRAQSPEALAHTPHAIPSLVAALLGYVIDLPASTISEMPVTNDDSAQDRNKIG
jgi:hypothetical protein